MTTERHLADGPMTRVEVWIDARPEQVWPHVIDLDLFVEQSGELQSTRWLGEPGPGARFTGTNRREDLGEWTTTCLVVDWVPEQAFGWDVHDGAESIDAGDEPMSSWRLALTAEDGGTRLTQSVRLGPGRSGLTRAIEARPELESTIITHRLAGFERDMSANLAEIGRRATG